MYSQQGQHEHLAPRSCSCEMMQQSRRNSLLPPPPPFSLNPRLQAYSFHYLLSPTLSSSCTRDMTQGLRNHALWSAQGRGLPKTEGERVPHLEQQPLMRDDAGLAERSVALQALGGKAQPIRGRKVDGLRAVQTQVEAAVVRVGERDDKLASLLHSQVSNAC